MTVFRFTAAVAAASFVILSAPNIHGVPPMMPPRQFPELPPEDRMAFVTAALQWRDGELQNYRYEATESEYNVRVSDGSKTTKERQSFLRLARKADVLLLNARRMNEAGVEKSRFGLRWDGSVERSLTYQPHRKQPRGAINDNEIEIHRNVYLNQALGLRMREKSITLVEWIKEYTTNPALRIAAGVDTSGETDTDGLILVEATEGVFKRRLWLDPKRDYLHVKYTYHDGGNWETHTVTGFQEVGGLCVPKMLVCRSGTTAVPGIETEYKYVVTKFERGVVQDDELELPFPPGTEVVDSIRHVAYDIMPDGGPRYKELYNPATGKVTINGRPPGEVQADTVSQADLPQPLTASAALAAQPMGGPSAGPSAALRYGLTAVGLGVAAAGVTLIVRKRKVNT
jgi:hypothetical protein